MPLEALLIPENLTDSDSDGIGGGTGCNFTFFSPCSLAWPHRLITRGYNEIIIFYTEIVNTYFWHILVL